MFKYFENANELVKYCRVKQVKSNWGVPVEVLCQSVQDGNEQLVLEAEKLMDQLNDHTFETKTHVFQPHVYGPVLSIPDYLTGVPTPFRHEKEIEATGAPVKVVLSLTSSGAISDSAMRRRGLAVSALIMKLQAVRPVELIVFSELEGSATERFNHSVQGVHINGHNMYGGTGRSIVALRIETRPMSLAHAINLMSSAAIARGLFYGITHTECGRHCGRWPEDWRTPAYEKWLGEQFQLESTDIVVPPAFVGDKILTDPIGWINDNLAKLGYQDSD